MQDIMTIMVTEEVTIMGIHLMSLAEEEGSQLVVRKAELQNPLQLVHLLQIPHLQQQEDLQRTFQQQFQKEAYQKVLGC